LGPAPHRWALSRAVFTHRHGHNSSSLTPFSRLLSLTPPLGAGAEPRRPHIQYGRECAAGIRRHAGPISHSIQGHIRQRRLPYVPCNSIMHSHTHLHPRASTHPRTPTHPRVYPATHVRRQAGRHARTHARSLARSHITQAAKQTPQRVHSNPCASPPLSRSGDNPGTICVGHTGEDSDKARAGGCGFGTGVRYPWYSELSGLSHATAGREAFCLWYVRILYVPLVCSKCFSCMFVSLLDFEPVCVCSMSFLYSMYGHFEHTRRTHTNTDTNAEKSPT